MAGFDLNNLLNGKSKKVETAAVKTQEEGPVEADTGFEVVMIDIDDLMPSKENFYSTEEIDELAMSIELLGGIQQNLVVKPIVHGKHEIVVGHRRNLAALKLVNEGKEEYRKVPCRIKAESDSIKDRLRLIFTNSTARQLSDWEKVQQSKELKIILEDYKKALEEENKKAIQNGEYCKTCSYFKKEECLNEIISKEEIEKYIIGKEKGCQFYERAKMGRIREIISQMLNVSTTQVGRMEAIDNNLSSEFKKELKNGNINISTAHELSRLDEEGQAKAYAQYEDKGELHIKDVKEEPKEEIPEEQIENVQKVILEVIKGKVNQDIFKNPTAAVPIEKALRKHFENTFKGGKVELEEEKHFIYRFSNEGITIINEKWENFLIVYSDLAEIIALMIEDETLIYDETKEQEIPTIPPLESGGTIGDNETLHGSSSKDKEVILPINPPTAADEEKELEGQAIIYDYPELLPDVEEKGLDFTKWVQERYGEGQYSLIKAVVRKEIMAQVTGGETCPAEWEQRITNAISVWVMNTTEDYKKYLES